MAATLVVGAMTADAATVKSASFDITGAYSLVNGKYRFAGDFSGTFYDNPKKARDYDLGISIAFGGKTLFQGKRSGGDPFSIHDMLKFGESANGFGRFIRGLTSDARVLSTTRGVSDAFSHRLSPTPSTRLLAACLSLFSARKCNAGSFDVTVDFLYKPPARKSPGTVALVEPPVDPLPEVLPPLTEPEGPTDLAALAPPPIAPVPLPAGLPLLAAALAGLAILRRR